MQIERYISNYQAALFNIHGLIFRFFLFYNYLSLGHLEYNADTSQPS